MSLLKGSDTLREMYPKVNSKFADLDAKDQELKDELDAYKLEHEQQRQSDQLKVAMVEKELNDYKATMQQVNIHQNPTQKASGHGIVSLPPNAAEGQVSVTLKGRTVNNLMGTDGDCEDTSKFTAMNCTLALDTTNKVFGNNGIKITIATGQTQGIMSYNIFSKLNKAKYYLITAYLKKGNCTDIRLRLETDDMDIESSAVTATSFTRVGIVVQSSDIDTATSAVIQIIVNGAEGQYGYVDGIMVNEITAEEYALGAAVCMSRYNYHNSTKSTISAFRIRSVSEDETQESSAYVIATDADTGEILELRSLPNGTKDEISLADGKMIKRVSESIVLDHIPSDWNWIEGNPLENTYLWYGNIPDRPKGTPAIVEGLPVLHSYLEDRQGIYIGIDINIRLNKSEVGGRSLAELNNWLKDNPITLTYQLAQEQVIPVQVSGTLVGFPSGTVYWEQIVPDAGVYTDKMEVLHKDLPIKSIEKLSKVDFTTGVEYELDPFQAVVSANRLSFTHPELQEGDIVFFIYEYDRESTIPEVEVEFYDSRYVVKDSATGKFYKWSITVTNGTPSIQLTEV